MTTTNSIDGRLATIAAALMVGAFLYAALLYAARVPTVTTEPPEHRATRDPDRILELHRDGFEGGSSLRWRTAVSSRPEGP